MSRYRNRKHPRMRICKLCKEFKKEDPERKCFTVKDRTWGREVYCANFEKKGE